ncbi:hypothetical protein CsSME_00018647 [Camellia sinensis var. sinensis]
MRALGRFIKDNGELNTEIVEKLFHTIDGDKDGFVSEPELKALILGMRLDEINFDQDDAVRKVMNDFDTSNDYKIDLREFIDGISKWLDEAKQAGAPSREAGTATMKYLDDFHKQTKREHYLLGDQSGDQSVDQSDEVLEGVENPKWTSLKAVLMLVVGTVIAAAFADPLVDAVDNFSDATSIPSFFISFIALPLATNSSEAVSAIIFASRKRMRSASLTFSEVCFPFFICIPSVAAVHEGKGMQLNILTMFLFVCIYVIAYSLEFEHPSLHILNIYTKNLKQRTHPLQTLHTHP